MQLSMLPGPQVNLDAYDWIVASTSGGKDSQAMLSQLDTLARSGQIDRGRLVAVHADPGRRVRGVAAGRRVACRGRATGPWWVGRAVQAPPAPWHRRRAAHPVGGVMTAPDPSLAELFAEAIRLGLPAGWVREAIASTAMSHEGAQTATPATDVAATEVADRTRPARPPAARTTPPQRQEESHP